MNARELRIGNRIRRKSTGASCIVTIPILQEIESGRHDYEYEPLTDEWLNRIGSHVRKSLGFAAYDLDENITIYYNTTLTPNGFELNFGDFETEIKYLHSLQNIIFEISNKEIQFQ